jgi:hypothetical protein
LANHFIEPHRIFLGIAAQFKSEARWIYTFATPDSELRWIFTCARKFKSLAGWIYTFATPDSELQWIFTLCRILTYFLYTIMVFFMSSSSLA